MPEEPCNKCPECTGLCEIVPSMAGTFKALGDLTRLQIIYLLSTEPGGTLGVSELAGRLHISQPAVSQHLKTLKTEGLVESRRDGFYVYYTINRERMVEFRDHFELMYASVMVFHGQRAAFRQLETISPADYRYWNGKGWFDRGARYFTDVPVNPVYHAIGVAVEKISARRMEKDLASCPVEQP